MWGIVFLNDSNMNPLSYPMAIVQTMAGFFRRAFLCLALLGTVATAWAAPNDEQNPLAPELRVNGKPISRAQVDRMADTFLTSSGDETSPRLDRAERRKAALKDLAIQEALAQAGEEADLEKAPEVADALAQARREILSSAYLQYTLQKDPVSEQNLRTGYEWNRKNGKIMEYEVRQILVPTRIEAENILKRFEKGEPLAELVKRTRDPGGNSNGGLVTRNGWFRPDTFVDGYFAEAVEKLEPGAPPAGPIRSRFGWHILWMNVPARPVAKPEPYEALPETAKEALRQRAAQRRINALTQSLLAKARLADANGKPITAEQLDSPP